MRVDYTRLPFVCAVPVRSVPMVSLHPEHTELAVRTELTDIGGHGRSDHDPGDLLYADFQLAAWSNSVRRQGAGRAGFYRGHYLKGIGRTPLAANWNDADDWYHASGHLFPSAAVREYLTSVYMEARGCLERLVPCTGLLLAPLEPTLVEQLARAFGSAVAELLPIDRALLAVSVKPAGFARASNFLWLASRLSGWGEQWRVFAPLLEGFCTPGAEPPHVDACTANSLGARLGAAARRSLDGLSNDFRAGVIWNSLWNNITLDGRVLDLEVATLACRPFLGATASFGFGTSAGSSEQARPRRLHGLEVIDHALELKSNFVRLRGAVTNLLELPLRFDPAEHRFMRELADELARLAADEALFGTEVLAAGATAALADLAPVDHSALRAEVSAYAAERGKAWAEPKLSHIQLDRTPLVFERIEPTVSQSLWLPPGGYRDADWDDALFLARHFAAIAACTDAERALDAVEQAATAIRARWISRP